MIALTRRGFLATGAAAGMALATRRLHAAAPPPTLTVTKRVIDIRGRAATVSGLTNAAGGQGLVIEPGARMAARLVNNLAESTAIHWHGQIPPYDQDGVPDMPRAPLAPGEARDYDFAALPGTFWMHSHFPLQEFDLLAAPLIVRSAEDAAADRQEVTLFLHDFSFTPAVELLAGLGVTEAGHGGHGAPAAMDHSMPGMAGMAAMDLNDIEFDAYLANDRTLDDPEVVRVDRGGRVLLRVINAASATVFHIDLGATLGQLVAVDGHAVAPHAARRFPIAMAQRLDIEIDLPEGGTLPILARREGAVQRTGIILAAAGAPVARIEGEGEEAAPAMDLTMERRLRAARPLSDRPAREVMMMLEGTMDPYRWTIDGATWGDHSPVAVAPGERVEITFHNMSMMAHPMHLHGHVFQVVAIDGRRFPGALRDTVQVPPMSAVTIAVDAGEAGRWMLHCHHMAHLATGMMTEFAVG